MALATFLSEIKARIVSLGITGYGAGQVFRGEMPNTPNKLITVYQYPGNAPELGFGFPGIQYDHPGLKVIVRGDPTDMEGPSTVMEIIYRDLVTVQDTVLGSTRYLMIRANQQPFLDARDGNQRCIWSCNFICDREAN
jgi:hypothetical protein